MSNIVPIKPTGKSLKIIVCLERRDDGGIRAWSEDVRGFVLSHKDKKALINDVPAVLAGILSHTFCANVDVELLFDLKNAGDEDALGDNPPDVQEYVARCA